MIWIEKYIPDLITKKRTLEDVRRARERETGKPVRIETIKRRLNEAGCSVVGQYAVRRGKNKVCADCRYWDAQNGVCVTPKQSFKGWLDRLNEGYCPLKARL